MNVTRITLDMELAALRDFQRLSPEERIILHQRVFHRYGTEFVEWFRAQAAEIAALRERSYFGTDVASVIEPRPVPIPETDRAYAEREARMQRAMGGGCA
jgi:hypothetical protein